MSRLKIPKTIVKHITPESKTVNEESGITMPHMSMEDFERAMKKINSPKN